MWTIDSFTPSDGTRHMGTLVDHQAWLRRDGSPRHGKPAVYVSLSIASVGYPEADAKRMLETMVTALNKEAA